MGGKIRLPYRLYQRGETWHAYISVINADGERIQFRTSCFTDKREKAENFVIEKIAELQKKHKDENGNIIMTVDEAFGRYYAEKAQYQTKPQQSLTRLNKLKADMNVTYLHEITETVVGSLITRYRPKFANSTINRYLALLSVVINTANYEWHAKTYPLKFQHFKLKEPAENIKFLKDWNTAVEIISKAAPHLQPIIYTALFTGLRFHNVVALKWENIDFTNKTISVLVKDRTTLGGKNHTLPMIEQLEQILAQQPRINEYCFNYRGKPVKSVRSSWESIFYEWRRVSPDDIQQGDIIENRKVKNKETGSIEKVPYKRFLRNPNMPYVCFHTLRHTAATWILKKTNNLRITQKILGHADIKTTLKYAHVLDEEKRKALEDVFG